MTPIDQPVPDERLHELALRCAFRSDTDSRDISTALTELLSLRSRPSMSGLGEARQIVCEEWQAFAKVRGVSAEAMIAAILNRIDALPDSTSDRCFICDRPLLPGQLVLMDVTAGLGHRECFGDDREGFVKDIDTGEPLGPDDPLPAGFPYEPATAIVTPSPAASADEAEANAPALPSQPEGEVGEKLLADLEALLSHIDDKGYMLRRQWTPELRERVWAMFDRFAALRAQPKGEAVAWAWTMRLPMGSFVEGANGPERVHKTKRCVTLFKPPSDDPDVSDVVALGPLADAPAEVDKLREALDSVMPLLTQAGNVAYNMKQTTSTVESAREFERINGWVDSAKAIARAALTKETTNVR